MFDQTNKNGVKSNSTLEEQNLHNYSTVHHNHSPLRESPGQNNLLKRGPPPTIEIEFNNNFAERFGQRNGSIVSGSHSERRFRQDEKVELSDVNSMKNVSKESLKSRSSRRISQFQQNGLNIISTDSNQEHFDSQRNHFANKLQNNNFREPYKERMQQYQSNDSQHVGPYTDIKNIFSFYQDNQQALFQLINTNNNNLMSPKPIQQTLQKHQNDQKESIKKFETASQQQLVNIRGSSQLTNVGAADQSFVSNQQDYQNRNTQHLQIQLPNTNTAQYSMPITTSNQQVIIDLQSSWKYLVQPSYAKLMNVIYHQNREVKLDYPQPNQQNQPQQQHLISQNDLSDFYSTKIKFLVNLGRELEVDEEPEDAFPGHQQDLSTCSEAEIKVQQQIHQSINQAKRERDQQFKANPILIRYVRESTIFFNSRFESGNLREAERLSEFEYNLYLNFDFNTLNYTQWYYFSVRNIKKGFTYKFNIMNLQKDDSSYCYGMKPFVYSVKKNKEDGTNLWTRGGDNIEYYKNNLKTKLRECAPDYEYDEANIPYYVYEDTESQTQFLNSFCFTYTFEYDDDIVFFSYFQPYTYNDLKDFLYSLSKKYTGDYLKNNFKMQKLCNTIEGNCCHLLTITDNISQDLNGGGITVAGREPKQVIYLTARVHPGESNSSFMIQGCIEFLLQQYNKDAQSLREQFIFKIVPMLNPDGVIRGNYRCNTLGVDLNRRWQNPSKLLHPTVYYSKMMAKQMSSQAQIALFCDMHGHSRKRNVFMYGCVSAQSDLLQHRNNNLIKLVPYMLSQKNKLFQFNDCKFANEREKESTARLVMFREFSVINSYTLESTFYAPYSKETFKKKRDVENDQQIKGEDLIQVGWDLCLTIAHILQSKILKRKFLYQNELTGGLGSNVGTEKFAEKKESTNQVLDQKAVPQSKDQQNNNGNGPNNQKEGGIQILSNQKQQNNGYQSYYNSNNTPYQNAALEGGQFSGIQVQANQTQNNAPFIKHQQSFPIQQDNNAQNFGTFYPSQSLAVKKPSQRTLVKESQNQQMSKSGNATMSLSDQQQQQQNSTSPAKRKSMLRVNANVGTVNPQSQTTQGQSPVQQQVNSAPSNTKIGIKANIMKQNIIEPPNQVNAILVNQFVHLSRGAKCSQQDLFKMHNQNQFKGLVSAINKQSLNQSGAQSLQVSPDKRNTMPIQINSAGKNVLQNSQPKTQRVHLSQSQQPSSMQQNAIPLSTILTSNLQLNSGQVTYNHYDQIVQHNQFVFLNVPPNLDKLPNIIPKQYPKQHFQGTVPHDFDQQQQQIYQSMADTPPKRPISQTPIKVFEQQLASGQKQNSSNNVSRDFPQPHVLKPTMLVFNPNAKVEYYVASDIQQMLLQQHQQQQANIPKMGNPIIQKALEQSIFMQQQNQPSGPLQSKKSQSNIQTNNNSSNQIGNQRRKVVDKLNSFKYMHTNTGGPAQFDSNNMPMLNSEINTQLGGNYQAHNYISQHSSDEAQLASYASHPGKLFPLGEDYNQFPNAPLYQMNQTQNLQLAHQQAQYNQRQYQQLYQDQRVSLPNLVNILKMQPDKPYNSEMVGQQQFMIGQPPQTNAQLMGQVFFPPGGSFNNQQSSIVQNQIAQVESQTINQERQHHNTAKFNSNKDVNNTTITSVGSPNKPIEAVIQNSYSQALRATSQGPKHQANEAKHQARNVNTVRISNSPLKRRRDMNNNENQ